MTKLNQKTILYSVLALVVAGGLYWYFFTGSSTEDAPLSSTSAAPGNSAQIQFRALVTKLQQLSFDTSIFEDPRFNALVDLTTPVSPESAGRPDPFATLE